MEDSILISIKKLLGIMDDQDSFDQDILIGINTALGILTQLGVGPKHGFSIVDDMAKWSDYIANINEFHMVKSYIYLKVRLMFDPPENSSLTNSINEQLKELEWRLNVQGENNGNL